jgi:hypothetical protein
MHALFVSVSVCCRCSLVWCVCVALTALLCRCTIDWCRRVFVAPTVNDLPIDERKLDEMRDRTDSSTVSVCQIDLTSHDENPAAASARPLVAAPATRSFEVPRIELSDLSYHRKAIASGHFGAVHTGKWISFDLKIGIKILIATPSAAVRALFVRECKALARVDHPNVLKLLGISVDAEGRDMIITEWAENGSLSDYMRTEREARRVIPLEQRLEWAIQCVTAIAYLHAQAPQVVHCDIKPANVLLFGKDLIVRVGTYEETD